MRSRSLAAALALASTSSYAINITETFTNDVAPGWELDADAYLTSNVADPSGSGWLRLTENNNNEKGSAIYNTAFSSSEGVDVEFEYATYGGTGADGITFYLIDGATTAPTVGAPGGSLGYSYDSTGTTVPGVTNGFIGIGFDEFGNFSNNRFGDCNILACGFHSNRVAVRGSGNLGTGFELLASQSVTGGIQTGSRAAFKKARIVITPPSPEVLLSVYLDGALIIDKLALTVSGNPAPGMTALPATFKMGLSSSTGGRTNVHEVRNLRVRSAVLRAVDDPFYTTGAGVTLNVPVTDPLFLGNNDLGVLPGATYSVVTAPATGTLTLNPDGSFTYVPTASSGNVTFRYRVCNAPNVCTEADAKISIGGTMPVLVPDTNTTTMNTAVNGNVGANDTTVPPGSTFSVLTQPADGTVTITDPATGAYTFTPTPGFVGVTTFTYQVCSGVGGAAPCANTTATMTVLPNPQNDTATTPVNTPVTRNVNDNDNNPPGSAYSIPTAPTNGTATINPTTGEYTYTPNTGYVGTDTFTYEVCVGTLCKTATVAVTVAPAPGPVATDDTGTTPQGQTLTGNVTGNDTIPPGATPTYSITQQPTDGTVTIDPNTGVYTFIPNPTFVGTTTFTYQVCTGSGHTAPCDTANVSVTVTPAATGPVAGPDRISGPQDKPINGNVTGIVTLPPGATPTYSITQQPSDGTVTIDPNTGVYTFTPNPGFVGTTTFTYQVCTGAGHTAPCSTAIVTVTVTPGAVDDAFSGPIDTPINGSLKTNDTPIPGGVYAVVPGTEPDPATQGTLVLNPDGTFTFTPVTGFTGTVSFQYTLCAPAGTPCATATASLVIGVATGTEPVPALNPLTLLGLTALLAGLGMRRRKA